MPIVPLSATRGAKLATDRIEIGSVVEYEQHGRPILAVVRAEKRGKWSITNQHGQELELDPTRLYLLPGRLAGPAANNTVADSSGGKPGSAAGLVELAARGEELAESADLGRLWSSFSGKPRELGIKELSGLLFAEESLLSHLATRRALLRDKIYFKRQKNGFEPRPPEVVAELKRKAEADSKRLLQHQELKSALMNALRGERQTLPKSITQLEQVAALGMRAENAKETVELMDTVLAEEGTLKLGGKVEDRAFQLLVAVKHFSPDQNLDYIRFNRRPTFSRRVSEAALEAIAKAQKQRFEKRTIFEHPSLSTLDSEETQDIDDALSLEPTTNGYRLGVHISDVASTIEPGSAVDEEAVKRATSIYCVDSQISMLPPSLSEDFLSLVAGKERLAISFFFELSPDYQILSHHIQRTVIKVARRLSYDLVDELLYHDQDNQTGFSPELEQLLLKLWEITSHLETQRLERGAISFARRELAAKIDSSGAVSLVSASDDTPARKLVSELMILVNETAALYAKAHHLPLIFRGQEAPAVDLATAGEGVSNEVAREYLRRSFLKRSVTSTSPMIHFGLGLEAYTHITSPIRRVVDLYNQRQLAAHLESHHSVYSAAELQQLLDRIDPALDEASLIQRERNRYFLLKYLQQLDIHSLNGIIVKVDGPKPMAEIDHLFILCPFIPVGRRSDFDNRMLGATLKLQIEELNPRKGTLLLRQVE